MRRYDLIAPLSSSFATRRCNLFARRVTFEFPGSKMGAVRPDRRDHVRLILAMFAFRHGKYLSNATRSFAFRIIVILSENSDYLLSGSIQHLTLRLTYVLLTSFAQGSWKF